MQGEQMSLYDIEYEKFKIDKPIRLIEMFSGYGSQALALRYLGVSFEHYKTCEWAIKSIQAYKDIHFTDVDVELNPKRTKEDMVEFLYQKGISSNYNDPMTKQQINRLSEEQLKTIIKNIAITHNLVNIQQVKGKDLEIVDTDKYCYVMTYSFPCQDLSLAGKRRLMSDTSTRSGMLWEVERILGECENKPQVHGEGALQDFIKWQLRLEELGYKNYWQDLIATDYGIPQTRNRCFMISILGEYSYTFPKPIPLKLKLKDMLEDNVDEKYYLSDKMKQYIFSEDDKYKVNKNSLKLNREIACSKTTREGWTRADTSDYITVLLKDKGKTLSRTTNTANTLMARDYKGFGNQEMNAVLEKQVIRKYGIFDKDEKKHQAGSVYDKNNCSPTIDTGTGGYRQPMIETNNLKIRKLTPRECGRLMGVKDEDITSLLKNQSDSSAYHLFGDSIVVNVIEAIILQML